MEPTYLHQTYLPVFSALAVVNSLACHPNPPFTDAGIDKWLIANQRDALRHDVLIPGYLDISDVPSDQALCCVIFGTFEVCCSQGDRGLGFPN
jgi:hypothetical protein